jgi:hypothetical protein
MRVIKVLVLILFSLVILTPAFADDSCRCQGCGPDGACVNAAALNQICGNPAGAPCKH